MTHYQLTQLATRPPHGTIHVTMKQARIIALVYQAGIANVFDITMDGEPRRLLQHAFSPCEWYAQGLRDGGNNLLVFSCNRAGDVVNVMEHWTRGLEDCPFRESARPPQELTGLEVSSHA